MADLSSWKKGKNHKRKKRVIEVRWNYSWQGMDSVCVVVIARNLGLVKTKSRVSGALREEERIEPCEYGTMISNPVTKGKQRGE
jgi:hypothetical protein